MASGLNHIIDIVSTLMSTLADNQVHEAQQGKLWLAGHNNITSPLMQQAWEKYAMMSRTTFRGPPIDNINHCYRRIDDGGSASDACAECSFVFKLYADGAISNAALLERFFGKVPELEAKGQNYTLCRHGLGMHPH